MPPTPAKSLAKLDLLVYLSTTLNTGHAHGLARETIILPVLARDEEPQPTTQESMFNYVRLSDGGPRRHEGPRSEIDVIASIAERVARPTAPGSAGGSSSATNASTNGHEANPRQSHGLTALDWSQMRSTAQIRKAIAQIVPGFEQLAEIDRTKQEFQIGGRTFHYAAIRDTRRPCPTARTRPARARRHRRRRNPRDDDPQRRPVQHGRLRR